MSISTLEIPQMELYLPAVGSGGVSNNTYLFRARANLLPAAQHLVDISLERTPVFSSIACSFGAELDSVLAYYHLLGGERSMVARGYDVADAVLHIARAGEYNLRSYYESIQTAIRTYLEPIGVETVEEEHRGNTIVTGLKTAKFRESHDVSFHNVDRDGLPTGSDVVLLNNLLYHFGPDQAEDVLEGVLDTTAPGGLLSLAGIESGNMGLTTKPCDVNYVDWFKSVATQMLERSDYTPMPKEFKGDEIPTLYQRL